MTAVDLTLRTSINSRHVFAFSKLLLNSVALNSSILKGKLQITTCNQKGKSGVGGESPHKIEGQGATGNRTWHGRKQEVEEGGR